MSIFFIKSLLSVVVLVLTVIGMVTMFEVFGRSEKRYDVERLKSIHKIAGILYLLLFLIISYYCFRFILVSKVELSARSAFHSIFAIAIVTLFGVKVSFVRVYRQFYNQAKVFGLAMALMTFGMVGISGGYYLLASKFGTDKTFDKIMEYKMRGPVLREEMERNGARLIRTDPASVGRGKNLFDEKCSFCHDPYSTRLIVGPGLKGILKNPSLPVSNLPATPRTIAKQLKEPLGKMPSFAYLRDEDVDDIIAFLNTL